MNKISLTDFTEIYARIRDHLGTEKQGVVAQALGMKPSAISDLLKIAQGKTYQKGSKNLPYRQLVEWALGAGVSLDWLLTGAKPAPAPDSAVPACVQDLLPRIARLDAKGQNVIRTTLEGLLEALASQGVKAEAQPPPQGRSVGAGRAKAGKARG